MVRLVATGSQRGRKKAAPPVSTQGWRRLRPIVYFDRGSTRLRRIYRHQLKLVAQRICKATDRRPVVLEGHANAQESERQTLSLSRRRAEAVAGVLRLFGVPRQQLIVVAARRSERARNAATARLPAWNRRVVMMRPPRPTASAVADLPKPPRRLRAGAGLATG